ncbi:cbb3-type cytochrome oxidase assembly protein CcoS [Thiomicrorhabdus indica]|jgi:cbb3-type cytochrome oxidase maturation protein|uniref:cbb3-type cytochrome oxidase assembly protein CcoS n=1 Tax=Thiomicrorhabdus indica TaxID=2267253 RepID=UPI00102E0E81|nr:cbb3-type cytochrome oxidase assembly protein CcoS [Thiomicrorhabdus indica]
MDVIYVLIPFVLIFGFLVVVAFIWMAKKGFFDDMDGQAHRILMDDDEFDRPVKKEDEPKEKSQQS